MLIFSNLITLLTFLGNDVDKRSNILERNISKLNYDAKVHPAKKKPKYETVDIVIGGLDQNKPTKRFEQIVLTIDELDD